MRSHDGGVIPGSPATAPLRRRLAALAEAGASGALHWSGTPGGVFYLLAGRIIHTEADTVPGLGERLIRSGRVSQAAWRAAYSEGRATGRVGRVLVRDGWIGQHELACRTVAVITDATCALLRGDGPGSARFAPGERHWLGVVAHVELGALGPRTARRLLTVPAPRRHSSCVPEIAPHQTAPAPPRPRR
jgi:hypothetical protein